MKILIYNLFEQIVKFIFPQNISTNILEYVINKAITIERYILLNPSEEKRITYLEQCLGKTEGPILAASDYMRMNSDQIRPYTSKSFYSLGTDGYGRSDTRQNLRRFFEVDKDHIVAYGLSVLANEQLIASKYAEEAIKKYNIDKNKPMPTKL